MMGKCRRCSVQSLVCATGSVLKELCIYFTELLMALLVFRETEACMFSLYIHCVCAKPVVCELLPTEAAVEMLGCLWKRGNSRWAVCLTLCFWNPFSGLPGPDMLRPRGVRPGRVPLLRGVGWARMWEPPGLLHGPVLWTRSVPGRHGNLQLRSQLDGPRLRYRWVPLSDESKHWQSTCSSCQRCFNSDYHVKHCQYHTSSNVSY